MSYSKRTWVDYTTTPADETGYDVEYLAWLDHVENALPEIAAPERPARGYASFQEMLDAAADEHGCALCGDKLENPADLLCPDCRAELIAQVEAEEDSPYVS